MKKMQLEICCGTTCYMLGANRLLNIENEMPSDLRGLAEVKAVACMGLCNDKELAGAPYVRQKWHRPWRQWDPHPAPCRSHRRSYLREQERWWF